MAWTRLHRTVGGNGQITTNTGYSTEHFDWANGAGGSNNRIETSPIDIPIKGDILVMVLFATQPGADFWFRIEHSTDGTTWYDSGQNTTEIKSTTDAESGDDISKLAYNDVSATATKYFFVYDVDTHGMAKYTRFVIEDNGHDESSNEVTFTMMPHNL
tara:strand:+ start:996 stop:1469 length:474 start_codon:yes stop_codon:yes gene_type:complete